MPMFSLSGLKSITDSILPLNIFTDQPNSAISRDTNDESTTSASSASRAARSTAPGEAGPGPSTTAQAATYRSGSLTSSNGPVRPSLGQQGSFAGSSTGADGGRRPSAVRVVDPEDAEFGGMRGRRMPRDQDAVAGIGKAKKRRKPQQDVSARCYLRAVSWLTLADIYHRQAAANRVEEPAQSANPTGCPVPSTAGPSQIRVSHVAFRPGERAASLATANAVDAQPARAAYKRVRHVQRRLGNWPETSSASKQLCRVR